MSNIATRRPFSRGEITAAGFYPDNDVRLFSLEKAVSDIVEAETSTTIVTSTLIGAAGDAETAVFLADEEGRTVSAYPVTVLPTDDLVEVLDTLGITVEEG